MTAPRAKQVEEYNELARKIQERSEEAAKTLELNRSFTEQGRSNMKVKKFFLEPRKIYNRDERDRIQRMISGNAKAYETSHAHIYGRELRADIARMDSSDRRKKQRNKRSNYSRMGSIFSGENLEGSPRQKKIIESKQKENNDEVVPFEIVRPLYGTYLEPKNAPPAT